MSTLHYHVRSQGRTVRMYTSPTEAQAYTSWRGPDHRTSHCTQLSCLEPAIPMPAISESRVAEATWWAEESIAVAPPPARPVLVPIMSALGLGLLLVLAALVILGSPF
jgi:hypothetical protein